LSLHVPAAGQILAAVFVHKFVHRSCISWYLSIDDRTPLLLFAAAKAGDTEMDLAGALRSVADRR